MITAVQKKEDFLAETRRKYVDIEI